jgi:class 3 adenylate cyclase
MLGDTDISDVLPTIRVPTLVLHRLRRREAALAVASLIDGARVVQVAGDDIPAWIDDEVSREVERFLAGRDEAPVPDSVLTTILFTDIVSSTERAAALGDRAWRDLLERHHGAVRGELARFGGREVGTAGDGFVAAFDRPEEAVRCALEVRRAVAALGLEVRAGLHAGEVQAVAESLGGIAVHIGARIAALAAPGEILVSNAVRDLAAGAGTDFAHRGAHALKGVPDRWEVFAARLPGRGDGGTSPPPGGGIVDRQRSSLPGYRPPSAGAGGRRGPAARSAAGSDAWSSRPRPPIPILRKALVIG